MARLDLYPRSEYATFTHIIDQNMKITDPGNDGRTGGIAAPFGRFAGRTEAKDEGALWLAAICRIGLPKRASSHE
jgi:hypothetical protein